MDLHNCKILPIHNHHKVHSSELLLCNLYKYLEKNMKKMQSFYPNEKTFFVTSLFYANIWRDSTETYKILPNILMAINLACLKQIPRRYWSHIWCINEICSHNEYINGC